MDREQRAINYEKIKVELNLKEYCFMTPAGYRMFFVLGKNLEDAEKNFMRIDVLVRNGFRLEDLPIRFEYDDEKCKDWTQEDIWRANENKNHISPYTRKEEIVI